MRIRRRCSCRREFVHSCSFRRWRRFDLQISSWARPRHAPPHSKRKSQNLTDLIFLSTATFIKCTTQIVLKVWLPVYWCTDIGCCRQTFPACSGQTHSFDKIHQPRENYKVKFIIIEFAVRQLQKMAGTGKLYIGNSPCGLLYVDRSVHYHVDLVLFQFHSWVYYVVV